MFDALMIRRAMSQVLTSFPAIQELYQSHLDTGRMRENMQNQRVLVLACISVHAMFNYVITGIMC